MEVIRHRNLEVWNVRTCRVGDTSDGDRSEMVRLCTSRDDWLLQGHPTVQESNNRGRMCFENLDTSRRIMKCMRMAMMCFVTENADNPKVDVVSDSCRC
jgi:hypothetical protein